MLPLSLVELPYRPNGKTPLFMLKGISGSSSQTVPSQYSFCTRRSDDWFLHYNEFKKGARHGNWDLQSVLPRRHGLGDTLQQVDNRINAGALCRFNAVQ